MIIRTTVKTTITPEALQAACTKAEHAVAVQAERDCRNYIPFRSGRLRASGRVRGNIITWDTPYARMIYFGNVYVDPKYNKGGFTYSNLGIIRSRAGVKKIAASPKRKFNLKNGEGTWFYIAKRNCMEQWIRTGTQAIYRNVPENRR